MLKKFLLGLLDIFWIVIIFTPSILYVTLSFGVSIPFILFKKYLLKYLSLSHLNMFFDIIEIFLLLVIISKKRSWKWINNSFVICIFYIYGFYIYKGIIKQDITHNVFLVALSYGILFNFKDIRFFVSNKKK